MTLIQSQEHYTDAKYTLNDVSVAITIVPQTIILKNLSVSFSLVQKTAHQKKKTNTLIDSCRWKIILFIINCYGLLLQRGLQEIEQPLMSFRNDFGEDKLNQITIATRTVLRNYHLDLHYDAFTTPKPGYTKRIFPLISISTLPLFTAGSTRRLQLFQSAWSLITKEAYLTCSMHINTDKKTLDRWRKSINYV